MTSDGRTLNDPRSQDESDWWATIVVGFPAVQRHESGRGFKPIQSFNFDYNEVRRFDRPLGLAGRHLSDPESVAVGDLIFVYCTDDAPPFGFLYRVTEIGQLANGTIGFSVQQSRPVVRFQPAIDADIADMWTAPQWERKQGTCPHFRAATFGAAATVVRCADCARPSSSVSSLPTREDETK